MMKDLPPEKQLAGFIAKYTPEIAAIARAALAKMRARVPSALVVVWDNYNALAIGFGPTERAADVIVSIVLYPRWVSLFFFHAAGLPDPQKLLKGRGKAIRHLVLEDAAVLDTPGVQALVASALERAAKPLDGKSPGRLVIKSISAKQRPRRPA